MYCSLCGAYSLCGIDGIRSILFTCVVDAIVSQRLVYVPLFERKYKAVNVFVIVLLIPEGRGQTIFGRLPSAVLHEWSTELFIPTVSLLWGCRQLP